MELYEQREWRILKAVPNSCRSFEFKLVKYWSSPEKVIDIKVVKLPNCGGQNKLRRRCLANFIQVSGKVLILTRVAMEVLGISMHKGARGVEDTARTQPTEPTKQGS